MYGKQKNKIKPTQKNIESISPKKKHVNTIYLELVTIF